MDFERGLGMKGDGKFAQMDRDRLRLLINLKLTSSGQPIGAESDRDEFLSISMDLLKSYREKNRLLSNYQCPVDRRVQDFLDQYLDELDLDEVPHLPSMTFLLDKHGIARELSLPYDADEFHSDIVSSYRVSQGVLHNPASDRRTTEGSFHIVEGGLPIPGDKKVVSKRAFAGLLERALTPPDTLMELPYTSNQEQKARMFVSLLMRPTVCPEIPGLESEKSMETRFFAPGNLVSNLDFVESIFGNAGNPYLAECDSALDSEHWTGHTGCVILAPHLVNVTKKEIGLPHRDKASERQIREEMFWDDPNDLYNGGASFKLTARDESGVVVTLIADNYFGYCKKEVKTQISYATNLFGLAEEEHAGGALAFPRRNHGVEFGVDSRTRETGYDFSETAELFSEVMEPQEGGWAIDRNHSEVIYVPQDLRMNLETQKITWEFNGQDKEIRLEPEKIYIQPNGYKIEMCKHPGAPSWRLVGTAAEGTFCHKPSTVSGGGKSEISKSLDDAVIYGPLFVDDLQKDMDRVQEIFDHDYSQRFKTAFEHEDLDPTRKPLSAARSLGSVIKLLTPSSKHAEEFSVWLAAIPQRIFAQAFLIKRFHQPEWGDNWRAHLSVNIIDGSPGHELKLHDRRIIATYLRVGFDHGGKWRTFKVRQDFISAEKIQMEDDISVSVVVPPRCIEGCDSGMRPDYLSVKLVKNCEYRLFQRPDDAIHPGFDKQTEKDMAQPGNFMANFEPLDRQKLAEVVEDVLTTGKFTAPMRDLLNGAWSDESSFVVSSAHPRVIDGEPSKNPRYLQTRPDLVTPVRKYIAEMGARLHRKLPVNKPLCHPVDAVLSGRRNNPPGEGIRPLAIYNPIHFQELPELFMDFVCSLTGKSPSTTGAGSEGALTKGPFNMLRPTADLNNTLVSFILTGHAGFSSSAGHIGPDMRVDHDVSLLIPEIWARLVDNEADPQVLIDNGCLEPVHDFEYEGRKVLGSRLGYRITEHFVRSYMGRLFDNPSSVFTEEILRPETQDKAVFVDGIENIVEAQQRVAQRYIEDGSIEDACPPLKGLLYIMATGEYEGMTADDPAFRAMFKRDYLLSSDWYIERLEIKQKRDIHLWRRHIHNLGEFLNLPHYADMAEELDIASRLEAAKSKLYYVESDEYLESLRGTIGADPLAPARESGQQARTESTEFEAA